MRLNDAIRTLIDKDGIDILSSTTFLGLLEDLKAFDGEDFSTRVIMQTIVKNKQINKIVDSQKKGEELNFEIQSIATEITNYGFRSEPVTDILKIIYLAIGKIDESSWPDLNTKDTTIPTHPIKSTPTIPKDNLLQKISRFFNRADSYYQNAIYAKNNNIKSEYINWLKKAAQNGHLESCFALGMEIEEHTESIRWFKKGADKGHIGCMNQMAIYYLLKEDYKGALKLVEKPILNNYLDSVAVKGICLFAQAMEKDKPELMVEAYSYINVALHPPHSIKITHPLDSQLAIYAQYFLGICYCSGVYGIPEDKRKAKKLLKECSKKLPHLKTEIEKILNFLCTDNSPWSNNRIPRAGSFIYERRDI